MNEVPDPKQLPEMRRRTGAASVADGSAAETVTVRKVNGNFVFQKGGVYFALTRHQVKQMKTLITRLLREYDV